MEWRLSILIEGRYFNVTNQDNVHANVTNVTENIK